ncbi:MAG: DUF1015 domain-containing protein [Dehalococcoidia bacterium]|nr:DUF1015 domain-containing protein [Dehalococcoidia bacterium]
MVDVRPFKAVRYAPDTDLSRALCPPFDTISPAEQHRLYDLSPVNAVRLEGPAADGDPYQSAARTLQAWLSDGVLVRDDTPAFYVLDEEFRHAGRTYRRTVLFARLRLEPWESGVVLPHERTFRAPKEDRMKLLRALRLNTSPVFLMYADARREIAPLLTRALSEPPEAEFAGADGLPQRLVRVADPELTAAISGGLSAEKLYVADGHHRYETALAFRDESAGAAGERPEEFALVALAAVSDPGLLVLPIHRLVGVDLPPARALDSLRPLFDIDMRPSLHGLLAEMAACGETANVFGLAIHGLPDLYLLTLRDPESAGHYLPPERSSAWRRLDAAIADHVILRGVLGLTEGQMEDIRTVWYSEDAEAAVAEVRSGRAGCALLLNPLPPPRVLAVADAGERMPQKSTFFYPKIPTGLVFNPLFER